MRNIINVIVCCSLFGMICGIVEPEIDSDQVIKRTGIEKVFPLFSYQKRTVVSAKAYTPEESKEFLGKDLLDRGYIPVEITIKNTTSKTYTLNMEDIGLPFASPNQIAKAVRKSAAPRMIGYKLLSFVFWPMMLASTADGISTHISYKKFEKSLEDKMLTDATIAPDSSVQGLVYVPGGYYHTFAVKLNEQGSDKSIIHDVSLS